MIREEKVISAQKSEEVERYITLVIMATNRSHIPIPKYDGDSYDIQTYLDMVKPVLDLAYNNDREKIAVLLTHLGKAVSLVTTQVTPILTWDQFWFIVIDAVQASLGSVVAQTKIDEVRYDEDIDVTLATINQHVKSAYPLQTAEQQKQQVFNILLRILPAFFKEYFTINYPTRFQRDIVTIRKLLAACPKLQQ